MWSIVALLVILSLAGANADRIVGGQPAEPGQFPYMVYLANRGNQYCGGSILSETWVISAAHCEPTSIKKSTIVAGDFKVDVQEGDGSQDMEISSVHVHPFYDGGTLANDIMLINLKSSLIYNDHVAAIVRQKEEIGGGLNITISGWGSLASGGPYPEYPKYAYVETFTMAECELFLPGEIVAGMICMGLKEGGKDTCQGDSGGPAVLNTYNPGVEIETLAGLTSWGYGCADANSPGVYTNVAYYDEFIYDITGIA